MTSQSQDLIRKAYSAFNARDVDTVLFALSPDVRWSNGWEGGYVRGHEGVRNYWYRQWKELDPHVEPVSFKERQNGEIEVEVHQKVKDVQGKVLFDGIVKHIYRLKDGLIQSMEIENP